MLPLTHANPLDYYIQRERAPSLPLAEKKIHEGRFQQWIDHHHHDRGTFTQRYYVDESFAAGHDAPVFFYICGEGACEKRHLQGAIRHFAQQFHARLVALEHRYYGESHPFATLSTANLRYLSTDAALDDLANFQQRLSEQRQWTGRWIAFGGSYPGSLAAYYRLKYPQLAAGALASSAPVMAKSDFIEYDAHVTEVAGSDCAGRMREAVRVIEAALKDPMRLQAIKQMFGAEDIKESVDFIYVVADLGAMAVQYGMRDMFCEQLALPEKTVLENYAAFAQAIFNHYGITAVELSAQGAISEDAADYNKAFGLRAWLYQSCSEYGYWQNAHPNPDRSTRSRLINAEYHQMLCKRLFGLTQPANTDRMNTAYYFPLMESSIDNIHFTNGEQDPWSLLSLAERNNNAGNPGLTYSLISGASHCDDLVAPSEADSDALIQTRERTALLLKHWLTS
ncbi:serine carboxypeptidase [Legionella rubrilucens]|uniref:Serine carboxypeptidase n=1 Tax=Legionella rubrilucens TaxID=458 RepID=A0A0W0XQV0_9GAMM|nr:S28 family serine protease [Legionella rubrilucens]KTD47002.1 serine carboxypeptidase [Legionella rubrilucens]